MALAFVESVPHREGSLHSPPTGISALGTEEGKPGRGAFLRYLFLLLLGCAPWEGSASGADLELSYQVS